MSEQALGYIDESIADCEQALEIWHKLPYSDRTNISYTYIYLSIAKLLSSNTVQIVSNSELDSLNDIDNSYLQDLSKSEAEEMLGYMNSAVSYDREFYGESSGAINARLAYSLEFRAIVQTICEKYEEALEDTYEAYTIYMRISQDDSERIQLVKNRLETLYEIIDETGIDFEDWLLNHE
jgi:hypothetical protein